MRWLLILCVFVLVGCTSGTPKPHDLSPGVDPAGNVGPTLPDGWRWESYRGVEVGVPSDWGWGSGSQRLGQWCINPKHPKPIVGRSEMSTLVGCLPAKPGQPAPETLIKNTGWVVAFDATKFSDGTDNTVATGGDRTNVTKGNVVVIVQAPKALRAKIAATVHRVTVDHAGCPVSDPAGTDRSRRPDPASDVTKLRGVTGVSVCKYSGLLDSSLRYDGNAAATIIQQIAAASKGSGPNRPEDCIGGFGDEIIVLRVTSSTGESQIYAHYANCVHNGFDDGTTVRTLTRAPMQALIAGPNEVLSYDRVLGPILDTARR